MNSASRLLRAIDSCLARLSLKAAEPLVAAFSGGPDSTALLWALKQQAASHGYRLHAMHLDHRMDPESGARAEIAAQLARRLRVPLTTRRLHPPPHGEAAARDRRYAALAALVADLGGRYLLTAHHADDQAETVLLRWLMGSGWEGLGAMDPRRGQILRPFLELRKKELQRALASAGLRPAVDSTNLDAGTLRNRIRHRLLPHLLAENPTLVQDLCSLAAAARGASRRLTKVLRGHLDLHSEGDGTAALDRSALAAMPPEVLPHALSTLHRHAGTAYPPPMAAIRELTRQMASGGRLGCDCGDGWRWEGDGRTLRVVTAAATRFDFTYTLEIPGELHIVELGQRMRARIGQVEPWMFRPQPNRAALAVVPPARRRVVIRSRRPGDRMQPLGASGPRSLKGLMSSHRIPRHLRWRLPLLWIGPTLAWVPGVAIAEPFRIDQPTAVWIIELEDA